MENVISISVCLLTELGAEPLNNRNGIGFGKSVTASLFQDANTSSTKQCDYPKSNKATNG